MKLEWLPAPVKTQWGDEMVVASVAIDKDHTVDLYCEQDQIAKVEAMFAQRKPLTDEQIVAKALHLSGLGTSPDVIQFARAIERAHGIHAAEQLKEDA